MRQFIRHALSAMAVLSLAFAGASAAHEYKVGPIKIVEPQARATAPGAAVGAAYMTLQNTGDTEVKVLGATTPIAASVEIHSMSMDGGVMRMRPVIGGLPIAAHSTVEFKSGGYHFMLLGLTKPLALGDHVPMTLTFSGGVTVNIEVHVEEPGAGGDHH